MRQEKIQEIQNLEHNFQNILFQKQAFQMELNETESALEEIEKSGEEVFKMIGQLMIKTEKEKIKKELLNKRELLKLRISSFEKQENSLMEKMENLRKDADSGFS